MANRNNRAYKEANVNNRRTPSRRAAARRTASEHPLARRRPSVARRSAARPAAPARRSASRGHTPLAEVRSGRPSRRRTSAARPGTPRRRPSAVRTATRRPSVARRTATQRVPARRPSVARRPQASRRAPVQARRPSVARRRPSVATRRTRTAGFVPGTRVLLKREATRTRRPVELRVIAARGGKLIGEERNGAKWEFEAREVARVARLPRRADQSTSTDIPGETFPAPGAAVGDVPTPGDVNLESPTADADGTGPDWEDDPRDLPTNSGEITETSPTAEEYSGDADDQAVPVAGTDEDITAPGNVRGLVDEDEGVSTDIPDDAVEVTAGRRHEARFFAAQRLAQLRCEAGVDEGDPIVLGHKIVASDTSLEDMQAEIATLDRVVAVRGGVDEEAPRKVRAERKGGLVPRRSESSRSVPSMASPPAAPSASEGDDFALFE